MPRGHLKIFASVCVTLLAAELAALSLDPARHAATSAFILTGLMTGIALAAAWVVRGWRRREPAPPIIPALGLLQFSLTCLILARNLDPVLIVLAAASFVASAVLLHRAMIPPTG